MLIKLITKVKNQFNVLRDIHIINVDTDIKIYEDCLVSTRV